MTRDARTEPETTTEPAAERQPPFTIDDQLADELLDRARADGVILRRDIATNALAIAAGLTPRVQPGGLAALFTPGPVAHSAYVTALTEAVWADRASILYRDAEAAMLRIDEAAMILDAQAADVWAHRVGIPSADTKAPLDVVDEPPIGATVIDCDGDHWIRNPMGWHLAQMRAYCSWEGVRENAPITLAGSAAGQ